MIRTIDTSLSKSSSNVPLAATASSGSSNIKNNKRKNLKQTKFVQTTGSSTMTLGLERKQETKSKVAPSTRR